jgi:hypothetical protein
VFEVEGPPESPVNYPLALFCDIRSAAKIDVWNFRAFSIYEDLAGYVINGLDRHVESGVGCNGLFSCYPKALEVYLAFNSCDLANIVVGAIFLL